MPNKLRLYVDAGFMPKRAAAAWLLYDGDKLLLEGTKEFTSDTSLEAELRGAVYALENVSSAIPNVNERPMLLCMDNQVVVYCLQMVRDGNPRPTKKKFLGKIYQEIKDIIASYSHFNVVWLRRGNRQIADCDFIARRLMEVYR